MKLTTEDFIKRARLVHGDKYDYSYVVYKNMKTKVEIVCLKHGSFLQTPDNHLNLHNGCPACASNQRSNLAVFIDKAAMIHGDKYDYSRVVYVNNKTPVEIICPKHGMFKQTPDKHLNSHNGCPLCANNILLTTNEFIKKAQAIHGFNYDYSHVSYKGNRVPVTIICSLHGEFKQAPYSHLSGAGCPLCGENIRLEHRDERLIHQKTIQTCLTRYGTENPMYNSEIKEKHKMIVSSDVVANKRICTKRLNQSFNTSSPEQQLGILLKFVFDENDIYDNYVSDKYPFKCDYYIKSRDMYIELNAHWTHGGHWYRSCDENLVTTWLSKSKFYQNAAKTFSVRDVKKRQIARENCLNYVVFWKSDLSDVFEWLRLDCPDGQDWYKEYSWL